MGIASAQTPTLRLPPMPKGYKALKAWLAAALRRIGQLSGTAIQIDGADGASVGTDGTMRFKVGSGAAAGCIYYWTPTFVRNEDGNDIVTLEPGSLTGATVTIGGTSVLDFPRPELSIPDTADTTQIVYLKLNSVTESLDDGFVIAGVIGTATIEVGTTLPDNTISTTSTLYKELFRWRNRAIESQLSRYNMSLYMRGASGAATVAFQPAG